MSRHVWFGLLLATGVALAGDRAQAEQAARVAESPAQAEQVQAPTQDAVAPTEAAQGSAEDAQASADETAEPVEGVPDTDEDATLISIPGGKALGMSILGNQEAPTSLVIVPWKSSEPGASLGISTLLDDSRQPVDKDVFMRALRYYEIRSETKP